MRRWTLYLLCVCGSLATLGCQLGPAAVAAPPNPGMESGTVHIISATDTVLLQIEIAATPHQHQTGLRQRPELPDSTGLIFLFQEEQPIGTAFWMYRTRMPLSLALVDSAGVIREIRDMEPCRSRLAFLCPRYDAGVPFHAALEVKRGLFERYGLGVGDRVVLTRGHERRGP